MSWVTSGVFSDWKNSSEMTKKYIYPNGGNLLLMLSHVVLWAKK